MFKTTVKVAMLIDAAFGSVLFVLALKLATPCGMFGASLQISYELWDAPCRPTSRERVEAWLQEHKSIIKSASSRFHVDARAIAGVISYEALENVELSNVFGLTRSSGPGKVHYKERYLSEGDPAAKQVEDVGLLPKRTMQQRRALLSSAGTAVIYIAAIMDLSEREAGRAGYDLSLSPGAVGTVYNEYSPHALFRRLIGARIYHRPLPRDRMGHWIEQNMEFIESSIQ